MSARLTRATAALDNDAIVIGGGPAGLSAALYLGRSRRRTLLVDAGKPRNLSSAAAHGVFTRDGTPPAELLAEARRQLAAYPMVRLRHAEAVSAETLKRGFVVRLSDGENVHARRLILALGVHDELPAIEGLGERWGKDVLHCVYCHGYEVADRPLGLIVGGDAALGAAASVLQMSRDLTVFQHGASDLSEKSRARLAELGVRVANSQPIRIAGASPHLEVRLADGSTFECAAVFVRSTTRLASDIPAQLGCELAGPSRLAVDQNWATSVRGVYAAGDIAAPKDLACVAAASGAQAAVALNADLVLEDLGDRSVSLCANSA